MKTLIQSLLYRLHLAPRPAISNQLYWQARSDLARHLAAGVEVWQGPHGVEITTATDLLDSLAEQQQDDRYEWGRACDAAAARAMFAAYDTSVVVFPHLHTGGTAQLASAPTVRVGS